ncbi:histidine kinase [Massilia sp. W12]|uniref:sensor histidine kinase n=1 Tax=Massilia sp. W12 TaxID=3126507 RepID=UPI0030D2F313
MNNSQNTEQDSGLQKWAFHFVSNYWKVALINITVAVMMGSFRNDYRWLQQDLVFSFCIGTLTYFSCHSGVWYMKTRGLLHMPILVPYVMLAVGVSLGGGLALGGTLLGIPLARLFVNIQRELSWYLSMMALMFLLSILTLWALRRIDHLKSEALQHKLEAEQIARRQMQAQLQLLQAQIEPHMLFNTLATLQGLISFDTERAQLMLDQLIQFLRASLHNARLERCSLQDEFDLLRAYLSLMQIRMGERLQFSLDLSADLAPLQLAPMLLQPMVENAIKHGLEPKIEGGAVLVSARKEAGFLLLRVEDEGLGLGKAQQPGARVGLQNTRERLQALYGAQARLDLSPRPAPHTCGALVEIRIPLQQLQT